MYPSTNQSSNNDNQAGPGPLEAAFSNRAADYPAGFPYAQLVDFTANTDISRSDLENIFANVLDDFYACYNDQDSAIADDEQDSIVSNDNEQDSTNPNDEEKGSITHYSELGSNTHEHDELDSVITDDELDSVTTDDEQDSIAPSDELDSTNPNDDEQDTITHHSNQDTITHHSELDSNTPQDNELDSVTHNHDELDSVITNHEQESTAPRTNELNSIIPSDNEPAPFTPFDWQAFFTPNPGELDSAIPNGGEQGVSFPEQEQIGQAFQPANFTEQDQFTTFSQGLHGYATGTAEQGVASSEQEQGNTSNEHEQYGQAFQQPAEYEDWRAHISSVFGSDWDSPSNGGHNRIFNPAYQFNFNNRWAPSPPADTCHMSDLYNPIVVPDEPAASHQPGYQASSTMHNAGPQAWYQANQINPADHMSTAAGPAPDWPQVQLPASDSDSDSDSSSAGERDDDYDDYDDYDDDDSSSSSSDGDDGPAPAVSGRPTYGGKHPNIQYDGQGRVVNRQPTPAAPPRETRSPRTRKEKKEKKEKKAKKGKERASASASRPATRSSAANPRGGAEDGRPNTQRADRRYQARRGQAWSAAERAALEDAMRWVLDAHPRATVTERWELASDRMAASSGVFRGPNAVKIQWGRKGRQDSGVDERRKPKPHRMTTSDQKAGARSCAESKAVAASGDAGRVADAKKKAKKEEEKKRLQQQRKRRRVVVDEDEDEEAPPRPLLKRRRASPVLTQSPPPGDVDMREAAVGDLPGAAGAAGEGVSAPYTQAQEAADAALARLLQQEVAKARPRRPRRG